MILILTIALFGACFLWGYLKVKDKYIGTENRHRWFAETMKDFHVFHNGKTFPMKKKLFESLHDIAKNKTLRILEIGAGAGANLEFYPEKTKLTVVDPNPFFRKHLEENLQNHSGVTLEKYIVTGAESMSEIPNKSIDAVVSTLVLCSCDKTKEAFQEISRVLIPGGKFYFMEHVIDDHISFTKFFQVLLSRLGIFPFLVDGCRTDKNIEKQLRSGPFAAVETKRFWLDLSEGVPLAASFLYTIAPHLYGTATVQM